MKLLIFAAFLICSTQSAWANAPTNSSSQQTSMMMPSSFIRKPMLGVRYEQLPTPEGYDKNTTFGFQFADYFAEKWMWGLQLGLLKRIPLPLSPTANLQYDFYRIGNTQLSWGAFFGQIDLIRYGTGLTMSHLFGKRWRMLVAAQWIAEDVAYETANGSEHDNFFDMYTEYFKYTVGVEIYLPKYGKDRMSFLANIGYQDYQSSRVTYQESPTDFQYRDGVTGFLEVRMYFD